MCQPPPAVSVLDSAPADGAPYSAELAPGVHAYIQPDGGWCLNNAGWVSDGGETVLVDTAVTEGRARALLAALRASGAPDPSLLVNTHHHGDHSYGNCVFTPRATVVGHASCRQELLDAGLQLHAVWPDTDYGRIVPTAPTRTYEDRLTLQAGGIELQLIHPGVAHTRGDTAVWLPEQRVLFAGDLIFHGGTPFVMMGSLSGSLHALDGLRALGAETVVPGHGPLAGPAVYDTVEAYLRWVDALAREGRAQGRTPLEVAQRAEVGAHPEFARLAEPERLVANVHRAYAELAGRAPGEPLDMFEVWGDMMRMNGNQPLPCRA